MVDLAVTIVVMLLATSCEAALSSTKVKIENSGYTGVVIAIHPDVEEDVGLIERIKETWIEASKNLYIATGNLAYFKEVTILVPKTWKVQANMSGNENYDQADVIIAPPNPSYGNEPYTVQHDGCGKSGIRTHFTPKYLLDDKYVENYGVRGKVVVHEWAHYRWGVFDETSQDEPFYWDPEYGPENGPVATKCPRDLMGDIRNVESDGVRAHCSLFDIEQEGGSYPGYCVFFPYEDQYYRINVSMMSYQYLDDVITFCRDHNESNPDSHNAHNIYAPNEQNRLCGMRSIWTIIEKSPDYLEWNGNDVRNISQTKPVFNVVTPQAQRFVLVLDDSGSMQGWKTEALKAAASIFITVTAPNNSYVGIVIFGRSHQTYVAAYLTLLNSPEVRQDLANNLNKLKASSGTSIGSGIFEGIDVLEAHGNPAAGHLLVITDGEEADAPYVKETRDDVMEKEVIVDTIFIENQGNQILKDLTEDSGGVWYFAETSSDLQQVFNQISVSDSNSDNSYQIYSNAFTISVGESFTSHAYIDATIGLSTTFTFSWTSGSTPPAIFVSSPTGCSYTNEYLPAYLLCNDGISGIHVINTAFRTIQFIIPGVAEVGKWTYDVQGNYNVGDMTSLVTSMASNNTIKPITIESGMSQTEVQDGSAAVVYAKVTQGYNPILGASVVATVTKSGSDPKVMDLYDNGAGSDIRKDDGIYSRYFTEYTGPGRYSVAVKITNGPTTRAGTKYGRGRRSRANYRPGIISNNGTLSVNPNGVVSTEGSGSTNSGIQSQDLGEFSRVVSSGGFDYKGTVDTSSGGTIPDTFPPGQIIDVRIRQKDLEDYSQGVVIEFTATGDDFDEGTASGYNIRYTFDDPTSLLHNFDNCSKITQDDLMKGNLSDPAPAGYLEELIIKTPDLPVNENGTVFSNSRLAFSIKAYDSALNYGEPSNAAVINFFIEPVVVPTVPETTIATSEATTAELTSEATTTELSSEATTVLVTEKTTTTELTSEPTTRLVTKKTTTQKTVKTTPPRVEVCDPDIDFYKILSASLALTGAVLLTVTVALSICLCQMNRRLNRKEKSHLKGVENASVLEPERPYQRNESKHNVQPAIYNQESKPSPVAYDGYDF